MEPSDHLPEWLPSVCVLVGTIAALTVLAYRYRTNSSREQISPNHAFTASAKIGRRAPTVLQFAARVPPSVGTPPTILESFDVTRMPERNDR